MEEARKECQGTCSEGVDWEVVSMTSSMYAASPGPVGLPSPKWSKDKESDKMEKEDSSPLFMSSHSEVQSMEHENLKLKAKNNEFDSIFTGIGLTPGDERSSTTNKSLEESFNTKFDDSLHSIQFYKKNKGISVDNVVIGEGKSVQEMKSVLEEQVLSASQGFDSYHVETGIDESFACDEQADKPELSDPSGQTPRSPNDSNSVVQNDDQNRDDSCCLPCGTWWKRHVITLYNHAKEANTLWSVIVAAALVGLVILGPRKRQGKPHLQQLRLHFGTKGLSL